MEKTVETEMTKEEAAQLRELFADCVEKIKRIRERMAMDQTEIDEYRAETRTIIDRLKRKAA
jgi:hypothetical protein